MTQRHTHHEAARMARGYADRAVKRQQRATGTHGPPVPWITLYLQSYRRLTGRPRYAGPTPVWVALPTRRHGSVTRGQR